METEAGGPLPRPVPPPLYENASAEDCHFKINRKIPLREEDLGGLAGREIVPDDDTDEDMPGLIDDPSGELPHGALVANSSLAGLFDDDAPNWVVTITARHSGKGM